MKELLVNFEMEISPMKTKNLELSSMQGKELNVLETPDAVTASISNS
jgi:hypothetical protein